MFGVLRDAPELAAFHNPAVVVSDGTENLTITLLSGSEHPHWAPPGAPALEGGNGSASCPSETWTLEEAAKTSAHNLSDFSQHGRVSAPLIRVT